MLRFESLRKEFRILYGAVARAHAASQKAHTGHGFDHDITVAIHALKIAPNKRSARKGFVASLLHSVDHLVDESMQRCGDSSKIAAKVRELLATVPRLAFTDAEQEEIFDAVMQHEMQPPPRPSETLEILQNADKLTNMMLSVGIRAGQFQPKLPALEFAYLNGEKNPGSTYQWPKSVLDDLRRILSEFVPLLSLPMAVVLGTRYAKKLARYIEDLERQYRDLGLDNFKM